MSGSYRSANATVSAHSAASVTPTDGVSIPVTRALFIGTGGDVTVVMAEDENTITFRNVANGSILPIQVSAVNATSTDATDIVALY